MVTDEERDYMRAEYVQDPRMKRNIGIGRRLAPLVDNDRRVADLLHALLFSFPGSPIPYYGDEIGMGDNIYLGDRDGVRTPMQWSPGPQWRFQPGGFRPALPAPALMDPDLRISQSVNVEAGMLRDSTPRNCTWMRRMLEVRRQHPVFGTGSLEVVSTDNPSVLAYVRSHRGTEKGFDGDGGPGSREDTVLCVCNLSRFAQPAELPLQWWAGKVPVELLGRVPFPASG